MLSRDLLAGTFVKTPHHVLIEVLAQTELDFLCLDAEHAPFDRSSLDACLAVATALDFPIVIRVGNNSPREILQALDYGAVGIVAPHIDTAEKAEDLARAARFGLNGRGYAGSSRWAGYATQKMSDLLAKSKEETVVIAQIEEPRGVEEAEAIAAYDEEMRNYYATRSANIKIQGWSEQMAGLLGKESRLHMRPFLESKGFLKR